MNTTSNPEAAERGTERRAENDRLLAMNANAMSENGRSVSLPAQPQSRPISKTRRWGGRVVSGVAVAFLLFDPRR